jgi:hypothetical protein
MSESTGKRKHAVTGRSRITIRAHVGNDKTDLREWQALGKTVQDAFNAGLRKFPECATVAEFQAMEGWYPHYNGGWRTYDRSDKTTKKD